MAKRFITSSNRAFLVESVELQVVQRELESLPQCEDGIARLNLPVSSGLNLALLALPQATQGQRAPTKGSLSSQLVAAADNRGRGLAVDFTATIGPGYETPAVFAGNGTYFVSGPVYCGNTVIEGGAVFKYPRSNGENPTTAFLQINGTLNLRAAGQYKRITFTAADDDSVGALLNGQIWEYYSGYIEPGAAYGKPALLLGSSASSLSFAHFRYCEEGLRLQGIFTSTYTVSHSQFVNCLLGIRLESGSGGCGGCGGGTFITANNLLLSGVQTAFSSGVWFTHSADINQCTIQGDSATFAAGNTFACAYFNVKNSILSGVDVLTENSVWISGGYNGFHNCPPGIPFGVGAVVATFPSPFQNAQCGNFYLAADSPFRGVGTAGMPSGLLTDLKSRSTQPASGVVASPVTSPLNLQPQPNLRYVSGNPDLGYYYDVADYVISGVHAQTGGSIIVAPGTVIALENTEAYAGPTVTGLILEENSSMVAHGTPERPIFITATRSIQEGLFHWASRNAGIFSDFEAMDEDWMSQAPPTMSFRFVNFCFPTEDFPFVAGSALSDLPKRGNYMSPSMFLGLRDCRIRGGNFWIVPPYQNWGPFPIGAISLVNNTFDRTDTLLFPTYYSIHGSVNLDARVEAYNNLVHGGSLTLNSNPSDGGNWVWRDNLLDGVALSHGELLPLDHDYNAYWQTTRLSPQTLHDRVMTSAPGYANGPFGEYYQPPYTFGFDYTRPLAEAGLFRYTMQLNQLADGTYAAMGLHYIAATSYFVKTAKDSDGDGVPDYVFDANCNGTRDSLEPPLLPTCFTPATKAFDDFFPVAQDSSLNVLSVLANDVDSWGLPTTIFFPAANGIAVRTPHGYVSARSDAKALLYTPDAGFHGVDSFIYGIVDNYNQQSSATLNVFVNQASPLNLNPTAAAHSISLASSDTSVAINLLTGCSDPDAGDVLTVYWVGRSHLGSVGPVEDQSTGRVTYALDPSFEGPDAFEYVITDGHGGMSAATVTISRNTGGVHAPAAIAFWTTAQKNEPLSLTLLSDALDPELPNYVICTAPRHGQLTGTGRHLTYTPAQDYLGLDSFCYRVFNGAIGSPPAVVNIKIQSGNLMPVVLDSSVNVVINTPQTFQFNTYDLDGDFLTFSIGQQGPTHGSVTISGNTFTYTPEQDFEGYDAFFYTATDGKESASATVYITVSHLKLETLSSGSGVTLKGNMTYLVESDVTLSGRTTIEAGTVVKYRYGRKLILNGSVRCLTTPWSPAIFTAVDDNSVGAAVPGAQPAPFGTYAAAAIQFPANAATELKYLRVSYAQTAFLYPAGSTVPLSDTIRHVQILRCGTAFSINGTSDAVHRHLSIGNCLMYAVDQAFDGTFWDVLLEHATVDFCNLFAPDPQQAVYTLSARNCIFATVYNFGGGEGTLISGDHNGFASSTPPFGTDYLEEPSPFAPSEGSTRMANFQAAYYLAPESTFNGVGATDITASLKAELSSMTTQMPDLLTQDITSSMTVTPTVPRESSELSPGYAYPAVDYVVNGATVNNCTLNIDQGTILAFTAPYLPEVYEWGIRVNPGGRLNVNGFPTNRVLFARLSAIQEKPEGQFSVGPVITFKGVLLPTGTMVTPLPEAKFQYADFVAPAGDAVHFGPLDLDHTYDCISKLELNGCRIQGGMFAYESGGPDGRTLTLKNSIFEGCILPLQDRQTDRTFGETFSAANNLFYDCDLWLAPGTGASWTFTDNIFDSSRFHGTPSVANNNNAYVAMQGARLLPAPQPPSDVTLSTIAYDAGPLGRFYLPSNSTLKDAGSRTPGQAALYHFTSFTSNVKDGDEAGSPNKINIGPHYLALVDGKPADSDSDSISDFIEDDDQDGVKNQGESDWQVADSAPVAIVGSFGGTTVSRTIEVPVQLDLSPGDLFCVSLTTVDGKPLTTAPVSPSGRTLLALQTTRVPNGSLTFKAQALRAPYSSTAPYIKVDSAPITITVNNDLSCPDWNDTAGDNHTVFNIIKGGYPCDYQLSIFDSDYPKSYSPQSITVISGSTSDGNICLPWVPSSVGAQDGAAHPAFYTAFSETTGGSATALATTTQGIAFPDEGRWYVAFEDSFTRLYTDRGPQLVRDPLQPFSSQTWFRDGALESWKGVAAWAMPPKLPAPPNYFGYFDEMPPGNLSAARTWPIRFCNYERERLRLAAGVRSDWTLLLARLSDSSFAIRNLYLGCHMSRYGIGPLPTSAIKPLILGRYHFMFLDGCESAYLLPLFYFAENEQVTDINDYISPPNPKTPRRRPAAAVAATTPFELVVPTPMDPTYFGYIPAEVAQYYIDFQGKWTMAQKTVTASLREAGLAAAQSGLALTNSPWSCLTVYGYSELLHNQYNVGSSW